MSWRRLIEPDIQEFIARHGQDDVRELALKKAPDASWPYALILDQIKVRQKARTKSPDLYKTSGFIFPPSDFFQQTSSEACAKYKAGLVAGQSFADLSAGGGIDGFFLAKNFEKGDLIERDEHVADVLNYNANFLKKSNKFKAELRIHNVNSEYFLETMQCADLIYIDPQRRDNARKGIFDLSACTPDVTQMMPHLIQKAGRIIIKTSPMLDIHVTLEALRHVVQVHVVEWAGECKEVLYILDPQITIAPDQVPIKAVAIDDHAAILKTFTYTVSEERTVLVDYSSPLAFIYEPSPAFQKAGGFQAMAARYSMRKIHPHAHLYTSDTYTSDFPGRGYKVCNVIPAQAKNLTIDQAEISVRHFPQTVEALRKKLKVKEGGDYRIFATTLSDDSRRLIVCTKLS